MYSIAGAFAGLIAYGIFQIKNSSLHNWQLLFIIEGALSIFMAIVTVLVLPARLETAWCKSNLFVEYHLRLILSSLNAIRGSACRHAWKQML
jgi:MFS family permease